MVMTIQDYLEETYAKGIIDHTLRCGITEMGQFTFYIHPMDQDGITEDFIVDENEVKPKE